ncbi:MAG: hypothetical protein WD009_07015 [Phycisphaeraceae bacterium]
MPRMPDVNAGGDRLFRVALIIAVVVLVLFVLFVTYRFALRHTVSARLDEIRERGEPVTLEEAGPLLPEVDDAENAGRMYRDAIAALEADEELETLIPALSGKASEPEIGEPWPDEMLAAMGRYVALNEQPLAAMREAGRYERARYLGDITPGFFMAMPHMAEMRRGARVLGTAGDWHAAQGDYEAAVDHLVAIVALAESLREEPVAISQFVRWSIHLLVVDRMRRIVSRHKLPAEQLARLEDALAAVEPVDGLARALLVERAMGVDIYGRSASAMRDWFGVNEWLIMAWRAGGLADLDQLRYLDMMERVIEMAGRPYTEVAADLEALEDEFDSLPGWYLGARDSSLPGTPRTVARYDAMLRMAGLAMAVERYRVDHGALPGSLAELVPGYIDAVPVDAFDGAALRYAVRDEGGYVIYSVGQDGVDRGGVEGYGRDGEDLTYVIER